MFDRLAWRREWYDRYVLGLDDDDQDEFDDDDQFDDEEVHDDRGLIEDWGRIREVRYEEPPLGRLAQMADDIDARGAAAPVETRSAESRRAGVDHPVGAALRLRSDRRAAAAPARRGAVSRLDVVTALCDPRHHHGRHHDVRHAQDRMCRTGPARGTCLALRS
jgi:hypothetical protein